MDVVVALVSGGAGVALGALLSLAWARRPRTARHTVEARLERIEHMLTAPDQAWYWTPEWQAGEVEADADLAAGRSTKHGSADEFLAALDALPAADAPSRAGF
ncbi:MAG: hypothetical protein L0I24_24630 [Pseudonocardia sp.]|nr:hypothetical protein [Pseudonocardia sp.]